MEQHNSLASAIINTLDKKSRCVMIDLHIGFGRSLVISDLCEKHIKRGGRVLVVSPRLELVHNLECTIKRQCTSSIVGTECQEVQCGLMQNVVVTTTQSMLIEKRRERVKFRVAPTMVIIEGEFMNPKAVRMLIDTFEAHGESKLVLFNYTHISTIGDNNYWKDLDPVFYEVERTTVRYRRQSCKNLFHETIS